jgi:hypothetical protein
MPSAPRVVEKRETDDGYIVVVKIRGPGTKDFSNPVAKRAKLAAARHVNILNDYIPTSLTEIRKGENINKMMQGRWAGEIQNMKTLESGIQQTVLYGIKIEK